MVRSDEDWKWIDGKITEVYDKVMDLLKDFQRATVLRVSELFENGQDRVLVADEVGMGKTMVAKGVIAAMARLRYKEKDDMVKVVYVCSNQAIANQNISEFDIFEDGYDDISNTRLSMQHLMIAMKDKEMSETPRRYIQLIPLTPSTSFRQTSGCGSARERMVICAVLSRIPRFVPYDDQLQEMMRNEARSVWGWAYPIWDERVGKYEPYGQDTTIYRALESPEYKGLLDYIEAYLSTRDTLPKNKYGIAAGDREIIIRLRKAFAEISVDMLNPDLVIMDEFQRFRFLINNKDPETKYLTDKFLLKKTDNLADKVRVLLLSATPYKLYSTLDELGDSNEDEHYREFLDVMDFLNGHDPHFHEVWKDYSQALRSMKDFDMPVLLMKKESAEKAMYGTVCRTERIAVMGNGDYTDDSSKKHPLQISEADIKAHLDAAHLLENTDLRLHFPIDYLKSCPYALSYMQKYSTKKSITNYFRHHKDQIEEAKSRLLWIDRRKIRDYEPLPPVNARFERLKQEAFKVRNAHLLLWVPPCRPYYTPGGVFRDAGDFSKTLVFSSWEMVPKMIATLLSYEEERRTVGEVIRRMSKENTGFSKKYFAKTEKRYPQPRLKITDKSLGALTLFYPSKTLAGLYNPKEDIREGLTNLSTLESKIAERINAKLDSLPTPVETGRPDESWYYLAPMLLDGEEYVKEWYGSLKNWSVLKGKKGESSIVKQKIEELIDNLREVLEKRRPVDLVQNLVNMVLGSPAVCLTRSGADSFQSTALSYEFINYFNSPETTAIIELASNRRRNYEDDHWESVLAYCKNGNFQAMLDEYIHLLTRGEGLTPGRVEYIDPKQKSKGTYIKYDKPTDEFYKKLTIALNLHSTPYVVESYKEFCERVMGTRDEQESRTRLRTHFAVSFSKGEASEKEKQNGMEEKGDRKENVRVAFNSPFWPFVVASTSIGQEGLDFHQYCRRIMHWNLPSNPVDLEQREGRINRFKCLAIRKNVAEKFGDVVLSDTSGEKDFWNIMFRAAEAERGDSQSELIPFWCFGKNQKVKIERILGQYPMSKDEAIYERLIKILSLYRLTLGQSRQEELLEYVFKNFKEPDKLKELFLDLSPFDHQDKS